MPSDPLCGLLKLHRTIDVPGGEVERVARQLETLGLLRLEENRYVRCVNPLDHDQSDVKDRTCDGRIYLLPGEELDDDDYQCPDCGRRIAPQGKQKTHSVRLLPDADAMLALVRREAETLGRPVREHPRGLFRIEVDSGEVQVCLVDVCLERAVFEAGYTRMQPLVFVLGNDRDYAHRVPENRETYRLVELALGRTRDAFRRQLRKLARLDDGAQLALPAVLGLAAPAAPIESRANSQTRMTSSRLACPQRARWNQVEMFYVDGTTLAMRMPGHPMKRFSHQDIGLANARNRNPTKAWDLLVELCEQSGARSWSGTPKQFGAFKQLVSTLRDRLQQNFEIQEDPFAECSRSQGLRARFSAKPYLPDEQPYVDDTAR